ncbi:peptidase S8 [Pseudothermotoga hypogea DSM 11164 = NBRC 106472]|uniref:Peptidase S8 n=1 Tax=Pseudothermotoga hypogea DSM 11164 = NBRC 106472 TaxID=1123384 RepID=A0A0X1KRL7_9THEM|nr:S8 family peptidase [Pseudothermotoga hypogea]AJC73966.1 peptidase S8 [Pseudothermotoga hypogea DSM 11164 = NBRC 106472]
MTKSMSFPTVSSLSKKVESDIIDNQYVVRFDARSSVKQKLSLLGKVLDQLRVQDEIYYLLETSTEISSLREELSKIPGFLGIEPHRLMTLSSITPNDTHFPLQWNLGLIRVPEAWSVTKGSDIVTIAVIDSGVDFSHEDLQGIFVPGYDFVENDAYPQDDNGHGTHVTGIIAALTNNNKGVAGVTWGQRVKIMPLKVLRGDGTGDVFYFAKAVVYAVDHGAKVINASLGSRDPSPEVEAAVRYAYQNDVVMVCAAGNDGSSGIDYPAAYPETIAVGAVTIDARRASYSDYGPELDVVAPGGDENQAILSTYRGGAYVYSLGTSMAAPHVTGIVALMISQGIVGIENIRNVLRATAIDLGPSGHDIYYGAGLVDAYAAVTFEDGWKPLIVFSVDENGKLDNMTVANGLGQFVLEVKKPRVKIYAWLDFDGDGQLSYGDLYGYYGYVGGNPSTGSAIVLTLDMFENREINFNIAPIVDTSNRPNLQAQDMQILTNYKRSIVEKHYLKLKNR